MHHSQVPQVVVVTKSASRASISIAECNTECSHSYSQYSQEEKQPEAVGSAADVDEARTPTPDNTEYEGEYILNSFRVDADPLLGIFRIHPDIG